MSTKLVYEIECLNVEDLNVEEMERRLELAPANLSDLAWGCTCDCDIYCECNGYGICPCNIVCEALCSRDGADCPPVIQ